MTTETEDEIYFFYDGGGWNEEQERTDQPGWYVASPWYHGVGFVQYMTEGPFKNYAALLTAWTNKTLTKPAT